MAHDILIVDDEADIRMLIAGVLKDEGYATREAADSAQALTVIHSRQPTLVILDIWLQGSELDGIEILRLLHDEMPAVPVVMISGHGTIESAVEAIKIGAYDFIEKPFKSDRLLLSSSAPSKPPMCGWRTKSLSCAPAAISTCRGFAGGQSAAPADRQGGADREPGPDHRTARRRQGGGRAAPAPALAPSKGSVCPGQLRDHAAGAARNRAVRQRIRDRRRAAQNRHLRARAWRHLVSR